MQQNTRVNFYKFMHKQLFVILLLMFMTAPGYILVGYLYTDMIVELAWYLVDLGVLAYGYHLYKNYPLAMTIEEKNIWLKRTNEFMVIVFSLWSIPFLYYIFQDNIELHYIAIATQLGSAVVASVILSSEKTLVRVSVIYLMLPILIYFIAIGAVYSYLLAFFTVVLTVVLLYSSQNIHKYLLKSRYQTYYDYLTGLSNRRFFIEHLENSMKDRRNRYRYLLLIDLDYFKTVNDTLGHNVGDKLLIEVAQRMKKHSQSYNNILARLGGDEFCSLSQSFDNKKDCLAEATHFSKLLLESIKESYTIDGGNIYISSSIGVSLIESQEIDATQFLKEADIAMYEAKRNGRDGVIIFNDELSQVVEKKLQIETLLHFAIQKEEIYLNFQPQVDMHEKILGCEVLVRWKNQELGMIGPDVFIPIAENTGYIIELGEYILEEAFRALQSWSEKSLMLPQISINISVKQLLHKDFISMVKRLYSTYGIGDINTNIIFEITETSTSADLSRVIEIIKKVEMLDIKFSIDDFGTGYSSLSYIRDIPLYELKIDQSFIANLADKKQASLVKSIIDISKNLNLVTVAEGIEEESQREFLKELGCDLYQGYMFYRPMVQEEFEKLITS